MKLSIVTTLYKSAGTIKEFYQRATAAAEPLGYELELIMVNDGSPDDSLSITRSLQREHSKIAIIDLSRNFGHHAAIMAGLAKARGDLIFLIDCDLEEQPEWLIQFHDTMERLDADVVFGVQSRRIGSAPDNLLGSAFWMAINFMSNVTIPKSPMTCRLMNRRYVDALLTVEDHVLYLAGVFAWAGFTQKALKLVKASNPAKQKSSYNYSRKLLQVVDSFSSFSIAPLVLVFFGGVILWLCSVLYGTYLVVAKLLSPSMIMSGFASVIVSIWFLSGLILISLGIIGLYLAKIFQEVKRRPLFIIKDIYESSDSERRY